MQAAAAAAADDALTRQRDQLAALSTAWHGDGGASAEDFVRRHCDAAEKVVASVRAAADALAELRDTLWQIVDSKVATVTAIDNRRQAERPAWIAAAQTVTTGVGDRAAASELVDQQVKPFVDNDIRVDWLTAVRTAITSINAGYDAATAGLSSVPPHVSTCRVTSAPTAALAASARLVVASGSSRRLPRVGTGAVVSVAARRRR